MALLGNLKIKKIKTKNDIFYFLNRFFKIFKWGRGTLGLERCEGPIYKDSGAPGIARFRPPNPIITQVLAILKENC